MSTTSFQHTLTQVMNQQDLTADDMTSLMTQLMQGQLADAQIGAILTALRMKGETVTEITAAVKVMRTLSTKVTLDESLTQANAPLIDTCGTGGDGANTFNISTACAFVAAAAGAKVAKHGNRSISSRSGSADLLEVAGVNLSMSPEKLAQSIHDIGVGFMFAPAHHSAMKHVIGARKALGVRTLFNQLGPLTNPAGAKRQVIGVYDAALCLPFAQVCQSLGAEHVMVVHAQDGLDEISTVAPTTVVELRNNQIQQWQLNPNDYGMAHDNLTNLAVSSAEQSLAIIQRIFAGDQSEDVLNARHIVILNAAAAIWVSGLVDSYDNAIQVAAQVIDNGNAASRLQSYIDFSQSA